DHIVFLRRAAEVGAAVILLRPLLCLVKAPVLAVEIEMIRARARGGIAGGAPEITAEDVTDSSELVAVVVRIGISVAVLAPQVDGVKFLSTVRSEKQESQLAGAVLTFEKQMKGMFGKSHGAALAAADTNAAILLKPQAAVGLNELDRHGPF